MYITTLTPIGGHNPYFSRWFSAIKKIEQKKIILYSHNPYFSRWFSAIMLEASVLHWIIGHNPYFSRWFSAIILSILRTKLLQMSQSLF